MASLTPNDNGENNDPPRICQVEEAADSESRPRATPREEKKEKGGYECEFVEPPPKLFQSECSICLLVLREPHIVSCCGNNFCETCIERVQRDGKPCPLCNEPGFTTMANKGLKRALNEFQVRCPHRELGCKWVDELGKFDQHLNADPQPEHQLEGCPFTSIECIHCKDHMRRHVIAGHQNERCPKRPYTCEYCEEYESTFEDVANHWAECKCYLLPCPNNCHPSGSGIERQNLEHHVKEECPLIVVECDFHYAGCGVKLPRKDMAVHIKEESMTHISLLAAENQRLAKQLLERDEQTQQLVQQNTKLSDRIDQQERAQQELVDTADQQQKVNQELRQELTLTRDTLQQLAMKVTHTTDQQQRTMQELQKGIAQTKDTLQQRQRAHQKLSEKVTRTTEQQACKVTAQIQELQQMLRIDIKMAGFQELKDRNTEWLSTPFYTHMCGYKTCLAVHANGYAVGEGTHVSVYTRFMRGEFDSDLKWPFRGDITIQLLNQLEDREHYTNTTAFNDETPDECVCQVTDGRSSGWGKPQFIPHSQLKLNRAKNCQYLKDDCLIFRVLSVKMQQ